jgi:hypothetical protein
MPAFHRQAVTGIGGVLATNLGAVLGITVKQAQAAGADMPGKLQLGAAWL